MGAGAVAGKVCPQKVGRKFIGREVSALKRKVAKAPSLTPILGASWLFTTFIPVLSQIARPHGHWVYRAASCHVLRPDEQLVALGDAITGGARNLP